MAKATARAPPPAAWEAVANSGAPSASEDRPSSSEWVVAAAAESNAKDLQHQRTVQEVETAVADALEALEAAQFGVGQLKKQSSSSSDGADDSAMPIVARGRAFLDAVRAEVEAAGTRPKPVRALAKLEVAWADLVSKLNQ